MDAHPTMQIRPATSADATALRRLGKLLVVQHHAFDPNRFISAGEDTEGADGRFLGGQIGRSDVLILVAEVGGQVTGYAYAGIEGNNYMALRGPAGVVYDLVVDLARRRQGIGRRLLDATLAALNDLGAPRVMLSTAEQNDGAQQLFAAFGFRRTMIEMTRDAPATSPSSITEPW
jgi:ribosomal protein S18 acetylase RimI-like enzyme